VISLGVFKSLSSPLDKPRFTGARFRVGSAIGPISPLVDWLMKVIAESGSCPRKRANSRFRKRSVTRGNCWDRVKLVHLPCCRESTKGWSIVVRGQGAGFDRNQIPYPSSFENLCAVHGRARTRFRLKAAAWGSLGSANRGAFPLLDDPAPQ